MSEKYQSDKFTVEYDGHGLIRSRQTGFWSIDDANQFLRILESESEKARLLYGKARRIADLRDFPVQSPEVATCFTEFHISHHKEGDRIAMVVQSALLKLQIERRFSEEDVRVFIDVGEAEDWLKQT